jgi:hypothetical protein
LGLKDESLHIIKCRICVEIEGKEKLLVPKWDFLCKHASWDCPHFLAHGVDREKARKVVQFVMIFHLL